MIFPLLVGREKSVRALEEAAAAQRTIFIVAQKNLQAEDPDPDDIYEVGIAYYGRTYEQGKKVDWRDGFRAIYCILKYNLFR